MLARLTIKNYILIHELEIEFFKGFSVITGETGSGKSILLGALGLIVGQRADAAVLLDKTGKCIVEGTFNISNYNLEYLFITNELDYDDTLIIRREINQAGKSRAFINDTPVNLSLLKELGERLVNIHSQNTITTLNDADFQLAVLDNYADLQSIISNYRNEYSKLIELKALLRNLLNQELVQAGEQDYNRFLLDELTAANLIPGELEEAEENLNLLKHAEEIKGSLYDTIGVISGSETNILDKLTDAIRILRSLEKYNETFKQFVERLEVNYIDLKDLASEISLFEEKVEIDPEQTAILTQRVDSLYRVLKKHQKNSISELISLKESLEAKLNSHDNLKEQIESVVLEINRNENLLKIQAEKISQKRKSVKPGFEKNITQNLSKLGIPGAQFTIEFQSAVEITKDGLDKIRFLFSANKGYEQRELSQTASGGELSRIMLSVKSMISQRNLLPTIIFDEIDNGVSGEVAGKVGSILKAMGNTMQVIAITHLPQIAGKGDYHYRVYKSEVNHINKTVINQLDTSDRVEEIAKMLSNEIVTDAARSAAKELMG